MDVFCNLIGTWRFKPRTSSLWCRRATQNCPQVTFLNFKIPYSSLPVSSFASVFGSTCHLSAVWQFDANGENQGRILKWAILETSCTLMSGSINQSLVEKSLSSERKCTHTLFRTWQLAGVVTQHVALIHSQAPCSDEYWCSHLNGSYLCSVAVGPLI